MKITITQALDRKKLIKFFRSYTINSLNETAHMADHLPYVIEYLSKGDANEILDRIKDCALSTIEIDSSDDEFNFGLHAPFGMCNMNINPPAEAIAWYESCSDAQKKFIDEIVLWRSRPAVC